jgi:hypothetical protein
MSLDPNTYRNDYVGNGSVDEYNYNFKIFDESELLVIQRDALYVETELVLNTDYTVAGVGIKTGGSITLLAGNLPLNESLSIIGRSVIEQQNNIGNQGAFYPEVIEEQFDKDVIIAQQQQEQIGRSISIARSVPSSSFSTTLQADILDPANAGKGIVINLTSDGFELGDPGAASATAAQVSAAQASAAQAAADAAAALAAASAAAAALSAGTIAPVVIDSDTSAGNDLQTLPLASLNSGLFYYVLNKSIGSGNNTLVSRSGVDLIHGQVSDTIGSGSSRLYWSDGGTNWFVLS